MLQGHGGPKRVLPGDGNDDPQDPKGLAAALPLRYFTWRVASSSLRLWMPIFW